jgi:lincosamide nucleotidyltransferase A/C/D/E
MNVQVTGRGRTPSHEMAGDEVVALLEKLDSAGVRVWIDGGWGVDALFAEQLRCHDDLDIVVDIHDVPTTQSVLRSAGYTHQEGEAPLSFMMVDPEGRQVDVHPATFDAEGNGRYQMHDGHMWTYTVEGLAGRGLIDGTPVSCLTPEFQLQVHAGYELTRKDHEEVRLLRERFGVDPPGGYERPRQ